MKGRLYFSTIIIFTIFLSNAFSQGLELKAELDKNVFFDGEEIYLIVTLRNSNIIALNYNQFYLGTNSFSIDINGPTGKLRYRGGVFNYRGEEFAKHSIAPGEVLYQVIYLSHDFANNIDEKHIMYPASFFWGLEVGKYTVQVFYKLDETTLTSEKLSFEVVKPKGIEQAVYKNLYQIYSALDNQKPDLSNAISKLNSIIRDYPQSVYIPLATFSLSGCYSQSGDTTKPLQIKRDMLEKFPDSGYAFNVLDVLNCLPSPQKQLLLNNIATTKAHTRINGYAKYLLKKLSANK